MHGFSSNKHLMALHVYMILQFIVLFIHICDCVCVCVVFFFSGVCAHHFFFVRFSSLYIYMHIFFFSLATLCLAMDLKLCQANQNFNLYFLILNVVIFRFKFQMYLLFTFFSLLLLLLKFWTVQTIFRPFSKENLFLRNVHYMTHRMAFENSSPIFDNLTWFWVWQLFLVWFEKEKENWSSKKFLCRNNWNGLRLQLISVGDNFRWNSNDTSAWNSIGLGWNKRYFIIVTQCDTARGANQKIKAPIHFPPPFKPTQNR